jgi:hypothetical protein
MALLSPGVEVQIIDESFSGSAPAGTIPLIIVATQQDKIIANSNTIAQGTQTVNNDKVWNISSQRELREIFGDPVFYNVQGTPMHGYELNEQGLFAAYSVLGLSNSCYVLRADIDTKQLEPSVEAPRGPALPGTYWLDTSNTVWGLFVSNGNSVPGSAWQPQTVKVVNSTDYTDNVFVPLPSYGNNGEYAVVTLDDSNRIYQKISGNWYRLGSTAWKTANPTVITGSNTVSATTPGDQLTINTVKVTLTGTTVAQAIVNINNAAIANITASAFGAAIRITNTAGETITITDFNGTPLNNLGLVPQTKKGLTVKYSPHFQVPTGSVAGDIWFKTTNPNLGANIVVKFMNAATNAWQLLSAPLYENDAAANASTALGSNPATGTVYVRYNLDGTTNNPLASMQLRRWNGNVWEALTYEANAEEPSTRPEANTLWYNTDFRADIMVGDGQNWISYRRKFPLTNKFGPIISGSQPILQDDGNPLVENDLWINSSDLENYPKIYRYSTTTRKWNLIDNTDQTTPFGIVFADARENSGTTFTGIPNPGTYAYESEDREAMTLSDFLDPDAPDPRVYPDGMLLFNTRYSTYNVKRWLPTWFEAGGYDENQDFTNDSYTVGDPLYEFPPLYSNGGRWVTASGNRENGSPYMGRKAQRRMIVTAMQAVVTTNENIRSELVYYNLLAAPGYPELLDELRTLNVDQKQYSFIVGDTPSRLKPNSTSIQYWAKNQGNSATMGEDGLTISSEYIGVYYPWGLSTNTDGLEIMIAPSTMGLRTLIYNDSVAYPWFAPFGYNRGIVTNAQSVGYLNGEGEYTPVILNQGQRDTLYVNKINPIAFEPNRGLIVMGQKTLYALETSALSRINVARLTNYLRYYLERLTKPFLGEPNDDQTRLAAKTVVERFYVGLVGLRALEDFAVVCDLSNNTPERRNRNELYIDSAIIPVKSIEFIFLPVRIRPSGDSLEFNFTQ